jgi:hypothetical protein
LLYLLYTAEGGGAARHYDPPGRFFIYFFHFFLIIARKAEEAAEAERVIMIREGAVKGQKEKANLKDGKVETSV